jgi:hypothetical protein
MKIPTFLVRRPGAMLVIAASLLFSMSARATLNLLEPFDYPVGPLTNAIPWSTNGTTIEVPPNVTLLLVTNDLSYPPLTDPLPVHHTRLQWSSNSKGCRTINGPIGSVSSGVSVYCSFMFYKPVTNGTTSSLPIIGVSSSGTATINQNGCDGMTLYYQIATNATSPGQYHLGVRKGAGAQGATFPSGTQVYNPGDTNTATLGQTNFVVMKYTFVGPGNDTVALWVNPTSASFGGSEPAATTNDVPATNSFGGTQTEAPAGLQFFQVRGGSGANITGPIQIDNLRVGTTWADVAPACTAAGIVTPPASTAVSTNQTATFTVVASGSSPTYQWQTNNGGGWFNITGATGASYTTPPEPLINNGLQFRCVVSVSCNSSSTNSAAATLTVVTCLTAGVTGPTPSSQTVNVGDKATFSVVGTGTAPTYQWQSSPDNSGWSPIANATNSSYTTPVQGSVGTNFFRCTVSNACDTSLVTSASATLGVVCIAAGISAPTQSPPNSVTGGLPVTFTVVGSGSHPTFQWSTNSVNIPGATNASYTTAPITEVPYDGLTFQCTVSVACNGSSASSSATISENCFTVGDAGDPVSKTVGAGNTATFTTSASGSLPTYQWQKSTDNGASWNPINGATNASYTTPVLTTSDSGTQFRTVLSVFCDGSSVTNVPAALTVNSGNAAFRTAQSGNIDDPNTWQVSYDGGGSWNAALYPPVAVNSTNILVQNAHIVTCETNTVWDQAVVQTGGQLLVNTNITLTITNGPGTDLDIFGTVDVTGTLNIITNAPVVVESGGILETEQGGTENAPSNTLTFNSGGVYLHNYKATSGTIPTATWNTGSTCQFVGFTSSTATLAGLVQSFYNFVWNCPNQTGLLPWGGSVPTAINGDLIVSNTGTGEVRISNNNAPTLNIAGNLNVLSGRFVFASGNGKVVLNVSNNVYIAAGGALSNNFSTSGGVGTIHFAKGSGTQVFTNNGASSILGPFNWVVDSGSTLNGTGVLSSNLTVAATGRIQLATATPTLLSVANNITASGGTAVVDVGGATLGPGTYPLMNYGGSYSGVLQASIVDGSVSGVAAIDPGLPTAPHLGLAVFSGAQPHFTSVSMSGTTLTLAGTNGTSGISYGVMSSTNLALPADQWTAIIKNAQFDAMGNFSTNILNATNQQQFFKITEPSQ